MLHLTGVDARGQAWKGGSEVVTIDTLSPYQAAARHVGDEDTYRYMS